MNPENNVYICGAEKTLLHISVNIMGMCNKTDKLMRIYGQYSIYFGVRGH